ncbi:MAG: PAS domain S-box protein, partial [Proteobacteria bacterium]|nr:PAS domain S-box protein [Pseudomonadota bacterium]
MLLGVRKSLLLRIALPVIALVIALGVMLDRFVLSAVSDHIKTEIQRDLGSLSRRISNICNINFENLLMAGQADNPEALIIKQALTLGQVEDFLVQESLMGIVYDKNLKEILLTTTLPSEPEKWVDSEHEIAGLKKVPGINDKGWFAYYGEFSPWDWQIIVLKNEKEYAALKTKVNRVHQNTLIILFFASILLIFFIYKTIKKPINTIIHPVKKGENPNYRGIDAFEFLSDSIAGMMDALKQSEEKYRSIVETTTGFVWEVDKKGNYTFASATIKDILGYEPEEVLGKSPFFFMPKEEADRVFPIFREKILDLKPFEGVVNKNLHKQGTIIFLETTGVPVFSRDGNRLGYRGINKDITRQLNAEEELKELERHRQQIQKLEAIGTLAAGLAHDFNNLLAVILGNISLSKMEVKKDAHIIKFLNEAEAASIRAGGLANQLITFSKGGMPIKTIGSIKGLLVSSTNTILQEGAVKPVFNLEKDLFMVEYDQAQMKQAFENIITNAVESMSHVGSITINAQNFEPEKNKEKVALPLSRKKYIKITIKDQGRGIDEQN